MKSQRLLVGLSLIVLALLALRENLSALALLAGERSLRIEEITNAARSFRIAAALGRDPATLAYNLGVAFYRRGDHARAKEWFADSLSKADPALVGTVHYNLGNCLFRQAEAAGDGETAGRLFRAAAGEYALALSKTPNDDDAKANLGLAQKRMAALSASGPNSTDRKRSSASSTGRKEAGHESNERDKARPGDIQAGSAKATPSRAWTGTTTADAVARLHPLSDNEVERLLSEARGRERPLGSLVGAGRPARVTTPEHDW